MDVCMNLGIFCIVLYMDVAGNGKVGIGRIISWLAGCHDVTVMGVSLSFDKRLLFFFPIPIPRQGRHLSVRSLPSKKKL